VGARPRRRRRAAPKRRVLRWLRRQDLLTRVLAVAVLALSVLVVALIVPRLNDAPRPAQIARDTPAAERAPKPPARRASPVQAQAPRTHRQAPVPPPRSAPAAPREAPAPAVADRFAGPRAAIVIDDLGQSFSHFEQLVGLDIPLSIAVIPGLPASARTVREASGRGIEMLLHQPMEPREEGGKNPGEGVLLTSMTPEVTRERLRASLAAVPGAVGVNNHMGSRFTEDAAGMEALMAGIREHGLFWLDSRTTAGTRGVEAARAAGVPALERDVFIDADVNPDAIRRQLRKLVKRARAHGAAVGIGHPHPETIAVLREMRAELLASGVTLVPVSALVRSSPGSVPVARIAAAQATGEGAAVPAAAGRPATR